MNQKGLMWALVKQKFLSNMQICGIGVHPVHYGLKEGSIKDERKLLAVFLELTARTGREPTCT